MAVISVVTVVVATVVVAARVVVTVVEGEREIRREMSVVLSIEPISTSLSRHRESPPAARRLRRRQRDGCAAASGRDRWPEKTGHGYLLSVLIHGPPCLCETWTAGLTRVIARRRSRDTAAVRLGRR
jgi:hypothetical protein